MKAKFYIGFLSALLLAGFPVRGQLADSRDFRNDESGIVINNYYDDYDYYYSSRINRFHRSYAAFGYYSPVFTDTYWYNWQPFSWGVSIYGRSGFGFGYSINYPVYYGGGYNNWYGYDYGWYDPYYGSSWYRGYDPFYYSWYSPVVININLGNRWGHNHWYGNNYWYGYRYRPVYNSYNYYNYYSGNRYTSRDYSYSRSTPMNNRTNTGGVTRRESVPVSGRDANPAVNRTNAARAPMPSRSSTAPRTGPTISQRRSSSSSRSGSAVSQGRSSSSSSGSKSSGSSSRSSSSSSSVKSRRK